MIAHNLAYILTISFKGLTTSYMCLIVSGHVLSVVLVWKHNSAYTLDGISGAVPYITIDEQLK